MDYRELAGEITSKLQLDTPPIALSFVETPPPDMRVFEQDVPSACTFWRRAESAVFYAPAEKHFNCPIGAMTMGFDMPDAVQQQLVQVVQKMSGCSYLAAEEPEQIPAIHGNKNGIVYGPFGEFPIPADLVLMWLTARQAMFFSETVGTCRWTESSPTAVLGRPGCAALPVAFEHTQPTLSLGCTGMRTFTEVSQDRLLAVVPGEKIPDFVRALELALASNVTMGSFYAAHKAQFVR